MNHKRVRLDNMMRPRTFKGSLLCLSCLFFLVHPFIVAPANLLPDVEPNRHYDLRILAETIPSNEKTQLGGVKPKNAGECRTHKNSMQESRTQVHQIPPRSTPQQSHRTQSVCAKGPKKPCHGIPKNRLGSYKTSSPNLTSQMNKESKNITQSQKNNNPNSGKHIPEKSMKMTEEEVLTRLNNLDGTVSRKDMYLLWFNLHNICVRNFYAMMLEVWMYAVSFASRYKISEENLQELWRRVHDRLIAELREQDKSCVNDFYNLFDKGACTADVYKSFLESRKKAWTDATDRMRFKW